MLRGTGKRAILDGYSSAGKTGTAQKIDASGRYSHRQHIASFGGFAPVNNPAVTVLVVLDSPAGGYPHDGGGEAAAPVFARIAQQVLAYMNVPHDVDVQDPKRLWLRAHTKEDDISEGAPDYIAGEQGNADSPVVAPSSALAVSTSQNVELNIYRRIWIFESETGAIQHLFQTDRGALPAAFLHYYNQSRV